ncbi:MAG: hypothetical protein A3F85_03550 [Candidatus Ryanbacteria bacterium RIFCSPLOWO2_12_FULL_44_26]|nr:MAG: hypothetical protein A3F85_03550 [Candidatus Ryanbacteria bacterium RIFCSPLOWO2_12_FULL_44_26]
MCAKNYYAEIPRIAGGFGDAGNKPTNTTLTLYNIKIRMAGNTDAIVLRGGTEAFSSTGI